MDKPTNLTRIYQTSRMPSLSSFEHKDDPLPARISRASFSDRVTDITTPTRRGIANNIHFPVMPDMYDAVVAQRITSNRIELICDHDSLEKLDRAKVVSDNRVEGGTFAIGKVTIDGSWVEDQSQALDSLRLVVEAAIYGNK
jgi:hypothetical protein